MIKNSGITKNNRDKLADDISEACEMGRKRTGLTWRSCCKEEQIY